MTPHQLLYKPYLFDQLYDGTEHVRPKKEMQKLVNLNLYQNDIAVFECQIRRFLPKDTVATGEWSTWRTSFRLCSITRLWAATANVPEEEESEDESMQRVDTDDEFEGF